MPIPHSPHAPLNLGNIQPTGVCDRCGFLYHLSALSAQKQWAGPNLVTLGIKVCDRCLDTPQEQLRTIKIGADPAPLKDPRPPHWREQAGPPVRQFILDDPSDGLLDNPGVGL